MFERVKIHCQEKEIKEDGKSFFQTANVTKPVKEAVDISIDSVQTEIEFPCNLQVNIVYELVRSYHFIAIVKDSTIVLRQRTELIVSILQS